MPWRPRASPRPVPANIALLAEAFLRDKLPDEARKQVARLAELEPKALRTEMLRARLLRADGKAEEAVKALEKIYAEREGVEDSQPAARREDGQAAASAVVGALLDMGERDAAERVARREAELRPADGWLLARVLSDRGRVDESMAACLAAVQQGGSRLAVRHALALASAKDATPATLSGAGEVLSAALNRNPDDMELILLLAELRHLQGRYEDELETYRDAIAMKPADLTFLNNMAWTLSESMGQPAEGLKYVEDAIERAGPRPAVPRHPGRDPDPHEPARRGDPGPGGRRQGPARRLLHAAPGPRLRKAGKAADARKAMDKGKAAGLNADKFDAPDRKEWNGLDASLPRA